MKSAFCGIMFLSLFAFAGCSGGVEELPPGEGGPSTSSPDEMKKQMEESMKKGGANYGGQLPGATK